MNNNWQPIETAPKDGTRILVYQPPFYGTTDREFPIVPEQKLIVEWGESNPEYEEKSTMGWRIVETLDGNDGYHGYSMLYNPTHWMFLPDSPQS